MKQDFFKNFIDAPEDYLAILQLPLCNINIYRLLGLSCMEENGYTPDIKDYECCYSMPLDQFNKDNLDDTLNSIYMFFNTEDTPDDYTARSLSVSDVVLLKKIVVSNHILLI